MLVPGSAIQAQEAPAANQEMTKTPAVQAVVSREMQVSRTNYQYHQLRPLPLQMLQTDSALTRATMKQKNLTQKNLKQTGQESESAAIEGPAAQAPLAEEF